MGFQSLVLDLFVVFQSLVLDLFVVAWFDQLTGLWEVVRRMVIIQNVVVERFTG